MEPQESFLSDRFEFKFLIDPIKALQIMRFLEAVGLERDNNSQNGSYTVNSIYFDTPFLDDYKDKDASLSIRKKLRVRIYSDSFLDDFPTAWVEVKRKRNVNILKKRTAIPSEIVKEFLSTNDPLVLNKFDYSGVKDPSVPDFLYLHLKHHYRPNICVKYRRTAYLDKFFASVRVTFDQHIRASRADNLEVFCDYEDSVLEHSVVMEIKFSGVLPWWYKKARDMFDLKRTDYSKYNHSVDKLRRSLGIPIAR